MAYLGGSEPFGQLLWSEAQSRGWEQHFESQLLGDGALWIWNLAYHYFFDSVQTVDWYYATQHLHAAAQVAFPQEPTAAQRWYNQAETSLFQGQAETLAETLRKKVQQQPSAAPLLAPEISYFENNLNGTPQTLARCAQL